MKKFLCSFLLGLMVFGSIGTTVFAENDITKTLKKLGDSATTRFQKPGFDLRNNMLVGDENSASALVPGSSEIDKKVNLGVGAKEVTLKDNFLGTIQKYLMTLVWIVAITVFIIAGFRLFSARGDEKEYTQAWKAFGYAIVGLAVIPLSYVIVRIVLGFKF